jgi:hypothetical protein
MLVFVMAATVLLSRNRTTEQLTTVPAQQNLRGPRLDIPAAPWERSFFEALEERTKALDLPSLRTVTLSDQDLEVRFWYSALK